MHFHDLRREFGCQLLESKVDLHDVREFLGHANVTTTSRYLRSTPVRLVAALERMTASAQPSDEATDEPARTTTIVAAVASPTASAAKRGLEHGQANDAVG